MSLNKKRPLAALYFAYRIIQRDFPLRAYVAPNVGDPFMGAHSFSSVNALYLHAVRHPNLLTGACYQDCHAFVRYAIAFGKNMTEIMARINAEGRVELIDDRSARIESAANMTPFDTAYFARGMLACAAASPDEFGSRRAF